MIKKLVVSVVLPGTLLLSMGVALAADEGQPRQMEQIGQQVQMMEPDSQPEQVYGWELMTPEERAEHLEKIHSFQTEEELEAYRQEHHKLMIERAEEQGIAMPKSPSKQGKGKGPHGCEG
ncbi:MAG: hypothetical protein JRI28_06455 [Deltaproteobacteria bacterium]|nr:hypothetical protein [Deltaproteobacteria bacterium]